MFKGLSNSLTEISSEITSIGIEGGNQLKRGKNNSELSPTLDFSEQ